MTPHQQQLCQSKPKYRAFFQGQRCGTNEESTAFVDDVPKGTEKTAGNPPKTVPKRTANSIRKVPQHLGPGTHLKRLLAELGVAEKSSCGCNKYASQMDAWGVEGCRSRRSEICSHLKSQATWRAKFAVAMGAAKTMATWLNPMDAAGSLLDEALRRAEKHLGME